MPILNNQPARSGNVVGTEGVFNLVDLLVALSDATPVTYDEDTAADILNRTTPMSGNMVASDGKVYNVIDILQNLSILPTYPTTEGTYSFTCTVTNSGATLSWESNP